MRSEQFNQGMRHAAKWAVAWLHRRAILMNDPHAKAILDVAADDMGRDAKGTICGLPVESKQEPVDVRKWVAGVDEQQPRKCTACRGTGAFEAKDGGTTCYACGGSGNQKDCYVPPTDTEQNAPEKFAASLPRNWTGDEP